MKALVIAGAAAQLWPPLLCVACWLLWRRHRSIWLIVAAGGASLIALAWGGGLLHYVAVAPPNLAANALLFYGAIALKPLGLVLVSCGIAGYAISRSAI